MTREPARLADSEFDLLVVGGGITGACLAYDAAQRGLSVALVEKGDFGSATSAASSKLLHGGVRYLQTAELGKLRESARERAHFLRIAPHAARYVPFLIPTYPGLLKGRAMLAAGIAAYELLSRSNNVSADPAVRLPRAEFLTREQVLRKVPALAGSQAPTGAQVIHEAHMHSSERMTLAFVESAVRRGAVVANYVAVETFFVVDSVVKGAVVRDVESGESFTIRARLTANAAGPWAPRLSQSLAPERSRQAITHYSKGAHLVTRQLVAEVALALPVSRKRASIVDRGGRHIFVIPWRGHSLIGTSDRPFQDRLDAVAVDAPDIDGILADVSEALPGANLRREDVRHAFAGLYPLTGQVVQPDVYRGSGTYQLVDHAVAGGVDGLVTVLGAKFTTARRLAEQAVDLVLRKLHLPTVPCQTAASPLVGGAIDDLASFRSAAIRDLGPTLGADIAAHLVASYGSEMSRVLQVAHQHQPAWTRLAPGRESIEAEVIYAVECEMAVRLDDVVFRRTGLGTLGHPGCDCLSRCAGLMADRLGWSAERTQAEIRGTEAQFPVQPWFAGDEPRPA